MEGTQSRFLPHRFLYEDKIMRYVCAHCIDFGEDGMCHNQDPHGCAIFRYLPELVNIAERIRNHSIQPYLDAVRHDICMQCRDKGNRACPLREALECGLDRYFPLVLEAIEEVHSLDLQGGGPCLKWRDGPS